MWAYLQAEHAEVDLVRKKNILSSGICGRDSRTHANADTRTILKALTI